MKESTPSCRRGLAGSGSLTLLCHPSSVRLHPCIRLALRLEVREYLSPPQRPQANVKLKFSGNLPGPLSFAPGCIGKGFHGTSNNILV